MQALRAVWREGTQGALCRTGVLTHHQNYKKGGPYENKETSNVNSQSFAYALAIVGMH